MTVIGTTRIVCLCLLLLFLIIGANCQKTYPEEVKALKSIKKSLTDPRKYLHNWRKGDPCSSNWTGVICYDTTFDDGYFHIKELLLLDKNLSGSLSPELGLLSHMMILDFMRNNISGIIPKEIGNIASLQLLLLSGNQLSGPLPDELGNLSNLDRIQVDENQISGPIPLSFANLTRAKHFHLNNNSLSGEIPPQLSQLPILIHLLLDNNNLSGNIPAELSELPYLLVLQLDNNNFNGSRIPSSYSNMTHLVKFTKFPEYGRNIPDLFCDNIGNSGGFVGYIRSLRNCSLQGEIPDWSNMPNISYIDLSLNQLSGSIPTGGLPENITTIELSNNNLNGTIPESFSRLTHLQKLSVANNSLVGTIPSIIWENRPLNLSERLILDFENNGFSNVTGSLLIPPNVTIGLQGNPACSNMSLIQFCGPHQENFSSLIETNLKNCPQSCPDPYEYAPASPAARCFCAAPLYVEYRMKSPGFSDFVPYFSLFENYLSSGLGLNLYQLDIDSAIWQSGPRLAMYLKIFPMYMNNSMPLFNISEVLRIRGLFSRWGIHENHFFGPFELLSFTPSVAYKEFFPRSSSGVGKAALAGIILGTIAGSVTLTAFMAFLIFRRHAHKQRLSSKRRLSSRRPIKIDGVKEFSYGEMALATDNFNNSSIVGQGGYGKVYRGILADGTIAAIKRAQEGSLQGEKEFLTEIELLSRLHHRNLVALIGYCDEEGEQMLVYEFMPYGTLGDHLSGKYKAPLNFAMRVRTALGAARGILYLHTEADPPIFHRDIKASNILLDSKFTAKVADFGLSKLATAPDIEGDVPSHVSTVVKGTPGYLDPEYFLTHQLTDRSDVYSLGVVFMELLTGMPPISHGKNIVREVNVAYRSGIILSMIDQQMGSYPFECVEKFIDLALKCCKDETDERPSMAEVVRELDNIWMMIPEKDSEMVMTELLMSQPGKVVTPPPSSSFLTTSNVYDDVSGSDLVSGIAPTTFAPR